MWASGARLSRMLLALFVAGSAACTPAAPQRCHRYDAAALTRENHYATTIDWRNRGTIEAAPERVEVSFTVVRPLRGPIDLVHVVGSVEVNRWALTLPDHTGAANAICLVPAAGSQPSCGAALREVPFSPSGYYYLRPNGNTVLEAGLAFYVCE